MAKIFQRIAAWLGARLTEYLGKTSRGATTGHPTDPGKLIACLRPGDVLLVEGRTRVSVAIKYLTQSTWSHSALFVGDRLGEVDADGLPLAFVEADIRDGVRAVSIAEFAGLHCRVCRPVGLDAGEVDAVVRFVTDRIGHRYDLRNVIDLARYLFPMPPVPSRWRRRMIALGSGDPTRAICSTLIAQAFESVRYPILPIVETVPAGDARNGGSSFEILHVRHYSLYVPRDFDVSPYFQIVKPTLAAGFDHRALSWHLEAPGADADGSRGQRVLETG